MSTSKKNRSESSVPGAQSDETRMTNELTGYTADMLVNYLEAITATKLPIVNGTGIDYRMNIILPLKEQSSIISIRQSLQAGGLDIVEEECFIPVLVLKG